MQISAWYPFLTLLVSTGAILSIVIPIMWRSAPGARLRRKSFWKSVDYLWIALAAASVLLLANSLKHRDLDVRSIELGTSIEARKAFATINFQILVHPKEEWTISRNLSNCKDRRMPEQPEVYNAHDICTWLLLAQGHLYIVPVVLDRYQVRNSGTMEGLAYMYTVSELHPLSKTSNDDVRAVFDHANRIYDDPKTAAHKAAVRYLRDKAKCMEESDDRLGGQRYDEGTGHLSFYARNYCELVRNTIERLLTIYELDEYRQMPWLLGIWWPFILAFGIAVRCTRTTAEFLIDRWDGK